MEISRRGFLGTVLTAIVGTAATFDPLRGLWVPQSAAEPILIDGLEELNDLALRFAKKMVDRIGRQRATILRQVTYQQVPHVTTRLAVEGLGVGHFERERRIVKTAQFGPAHTDDLLAHLADQTVSEWRSLHGRIDMFAPMTTELRPGVPFTDALVTVVADPETGLSVRASRYKQLEGPFLTSMEVGAGTWHRYGELLGRVNDRGVWVDA